MKIKIGIAGSCTKLSDEIAEKSAEIGNQIARSNCVLLTGSGIGVSSEAAKAAKKADGLVIGISPACSKKEHVETYQCSTDAFDVLVFSGFGYKGRNVLFIRSCDAVIIVSGGLGTLNEFTIAYDEGKTIGVLTETGGVADAIKCIERLAIKNRGKDGLVLYDSDPSLLVKKVLAAVRKEQHVLAS